MDGDIYPSGYEFCNPRNATKKNKPVQKPFKN